MFFLAHIFPGGGSPLVADTAAVAIAIALFALLYVSIELIDRV